MLVEKREIEKHIEKIIRDIILDNEICSKLYDICREKYNIPHNISSDYITTRRSLEEANVFVLFALMDSYEIIKKKTTSKLPNFFTQNEINMFRIYKYEEKKLSFPLKFPMIQVAEDQWVGTIDVETLVLMREAGIINYNQNAQRVLKRVVRGENQYYMISVNKRAVNQIAESLESQNFISNTITLNIPLEIESSFYYNAKQRELIIESLDHFDITDGYHRYLALCKAKDKNPEFDYTMELRIVNFDEDKARRFIYQEDQKTQMKKTDVNAYDTTNGGNRVATRLNDNSNLQGQILMNGGVIHYPDLAGLIDYFYFKGVTKEKKNVTVLQASNELTILFNGLTEHNTKYLTQRYTYKVLAVVMFCFYYYRNKDQSNIYLVIDAVVDRVNKEVNNIKFYGREPKRSMMNEIEKIVKEVE